MPLRAGEVFVDVFPDLRKFGDSLKRQMAAQTSGLKRQTDQLSQNVTRSFDDMGKSVEGTTADIGTFGDTVESSNEKSKRSFQSLLPSLGQTATGFGQLGDAALNAQDRVAEAQERVTRSGIELQRAQQRLAAIQSSGTGDANALATAQSRVDEAQIRVSRASREADSAQRRFNASMSDGGRDSSFLGSNLSGLLPDIGRVNSSFTLLGRTLGILKWPVIVQGANFAAAALSSLGAAAVGAVASLAPLIGLLGAIPAGLTAIGSAVGTAAAGFFGVGDALGAMSAAATASGAATSGAAGATEDAGARIADAGRAVEAAQRGVADANRAVQDSERSLADSQRQVMYAQEALTDAREDARQTLRDLRDEVEGNALSERQAELNLAQARARLREVQRDENATRLDVQQAILDVQQAEFDLGETREDNRENQQALNEAERDGVSGSEQVIDARRSLADANRGVADAERALAEAHRGVADAQRAVAEAQRSVTEAMTSGTGSVAAMSAESTALAEAMAALSPAGREFVRVLFAMKPKLDEIRATAQEGLLPGVGRAIQTLGREMFPLLNRAVGATARTMGSLAEEGAALITSGPWKRDFATLLRGNSRLLTNFTHVAFNLGDAFLQIGVAAQPLAFWLGRIAERASKAIAVFFGEARRSGGLAEFFERTREATERLLSILGNLGEILVDVLGAGQSFGRWLLRQLDELTAGWAEFTGSVEGQNALKKWFEDAKPVVIALGRLIGDIAKMFGDMATTRGLPQLINQLRTQLLPVIDDIFRTSSGKLIPALVDMATQFGKLFKVFGVEHGFMITFVKSLTTIFRVITKLIETVPGLGPAFASVGTAAGVFAAIRFTGMITGLSSLVKHFTGVGGGAAEATKKASLLQRALSGLGSRGLVLGLNPIAGILAGITAELVAFGTAMVRTKERTDGFRQAFVEQGKATKDGQTAFEDYAKALRQGGQHLQESTSLVVNPLQQKALDELEQSRRRYIELVKNSTVGQRAYNRAIEHGAGVLDALDAAERAIHHTEKLRGDTLLGTRNAQRTFNQAMSRASGITTGQREKIAELIGAVGRLGGKFGETARKGLENVLSMGDQGRAIDILKEKIRSIPVQVSTAYTFDDHGIDDALNGLGNRLYGQGTRAAQQYNQGFKSYQQMQSPSKVWIGFGENLMSSLAKGIETGKDAKAKIKDIWGDIHKSVKESIEGIKDAVREGMKDVKKWWFDGWEDVRKKLGDTWDAIKDAVRSGFDVLRDAFGNQLDALRRAWSNAWDAIRNVLGNAWDAIKRAVQNGVDAVANFFRSLPSKVLGFLRELPPKMFEIGKSIIARLIDGIQNAPSLIKDAVTKLFDFDIKLPSLFGGGDGLGIEVGGAGGTPTQMFQALSAAVPGTQVITSGYRPGAITSSGNASLHSIEPPWNAVDIGGDNLMATAQAAVAAFGSRLRELIYTPLGFSIKDGQRVAPIAAADHYDHVHLADKGGVFKGPGMVGIGPITETVFQPAAKISELPESGQPESRIADLITALPRMLRDSWIQAFRAIAPKVSPSMNNETKVSERREFIHLADTGGVFRGPGMVGVGGINETVFQPARKVSDLPQSRSGQIQGAITILNWETGEAYFRGMITNELDEDRNFQNYRGRAY